MRVDGIGRFCRQEMTASAAAAPSGFIVARACAAVFYRRYDAPAPPLPSP